MESIQQRPNRKRKAEEADICQFDDSDPKRVKLSTNNSNDDIITNNNSTNSTTTNEPKNPFVSFANQGIGFDSLINNTSPTNKQSFPLSISTSPHKPTTKQSKNSPTKQQSETKDNTNTSLLPAWSDGNNNSFGTFSDSTANSLGWINNNNNNNNNNDNTTGWGNTNNEFKFDESNSKFSLADIADGTGINNNKESDDLKDSKPIATLMGVCDAGDLDDNTIIDIKCTVYELDIINNRYKEKGNGIVKLNTYKPKDDNNGQIHARLLCRQEIVKKCLINAVFIKETKFDKATEKSVRFTVFEQKDKKIICENDGDDKKDKKSKIETVNVTKSYLLKSRESDKKKIDRFLDEIKKIQDKM